MANAPGSQALKPRAERFAVLLCDGMTQLPAYCQSAEPPVPPSKGRQVAASRLANREDVRDRVAFLKRERADARSVNAEPVTRQAIHSLLEEVTAALRAGSEAASRAGSGAIAQQLNRVILTHSGRSNRASVRAPVEEKADLTFDTELALTRLSWCRCND